jgi:hypothetical protein
MTKLRAVDRFFRKLEWVKEQNRKARQYRGRTPLQRQKAQEKARKQLEAMNAR